MSGNGERAVLWLRRDLRRADLPALGEAARRGTVLPLFVIDPVLWHGAGAPRRGWLAASVAAAGEAYAGRLSVRIGDPAEVVARFAADHGADAVHVSGENTPYGRRRDERVASALEEQGTAWIPTGTPYAVDPGTVLNKAGDPYQVFSAFARAWREHGYPAPAPAPDPLELGEADTDGRAPAMLDKAVREAGVPMPQAGEQGALARWHRFLDDTLDDYDEARDHPAVAGTSQLSPWLKVGAVHPRTLLADLASRRSDSARRYRDELTWREFYADVLLHRPDSAWADLRPDLRGLRYDEPQDALDAWREGRTGFPIVDAGMRQLQESGWMHNRVRMITASFWTKDLHAWWPPAARHFLDHLLDGDVASNNHGWQWVAGTGTDAAPYFRVFNPVTQGKRFDPDGAYVRRWIPELRHLRGGIAHEPWRHDDGYRHDYPRRIVDHDEERKEALARYQAARR
ncbi:MAG: cryptochrome/photolyase family protein [Marmoricola sp.]